MARSDRLAAHIEKSLVDRDAWTALFRQLAITVLEVNCDALGGSIAAQGLMARSSFPTVPASSTLLVRFGSPGLQSLWISSEQQLVGEEALGKSLLRPALHTAQACKTPEGLRVKPMLVPLSDKMPN